AVNAQDAIAENGAMVLETGQLVLDEEYVRQYPGLKPGPYVQLTFTDDGCGMTEETLRHIYEPFFTTKEVGRGTGLGLATVYGIVKQHDGYIDVWSKPGAGTTFRMFLPLSQSQVRAASRQEAGSRAEAAVGAGKTVLLVEDNAMIREMAQE